MGTHHGHTDAGGSDFHILVVPDLGRFFDHLQLLLVVAGVHIHVRVVAEQVKGVLHWEDLGHSRLAIHDVSGLLPQLLHGSCTSSGRSLVGGHNHALDGGQLVQGGDGHEGDDGRAVGVGNDAALADLAVGHVVRVDLRDDQGHTLSHSECAAVVNDHCASLSCQGPELLADGAASAEQGNVHILEAVSCQLLHLIRLAIKLLLLPGRPSGGQHLHVAVREVALLQHRQELLTYGAGNAHDGDLRT
mmetsp:Transcript_12242/g.33420  ORF Transcript_12242/g.33420 Transcript_12242/m.33420 type:complete len:246 (-) Transcript_12242:134-871(-)